MQSFVHSSCCDSLVARREVYFGEFAYLEIYPENDLCENVNRRKIEIPWHTHIFKASYCLKVHNAPLKLVLSISGWEWGLVAFAFLAKILGRFHTPVYAILSVYECSPNS